MKIKAEISLSSSSSSSLLAHKAPLMIIHRLCLVTQRVLCQVTLQTFLFGNLIDIAFNCPFPNKIDDSNFALYHIRIPYHTASRVKRCDAQPLCQAGRFVMSPLTDTKAVRETSHEQCTIISNCPLLLSFSNALMS